VVPAGIFSQFIEPRPLNLRLGPSTRRVSPLLRRPRFSARRPGWAARRLAARSSAGPGGIIRVAAITGSRVCFRRIQRGRGGRAGLVRARVEPLRPTSSSSTAGDRPSLHWREQDRRPWTKAKAGGGVLLATGPGQPPWANLRRRNGLLSRTGGATGARVKRCKGAGRSQPGGARLSFKRARAFAMVMKDEPIDHPARGLRQTEERVDEVVWAGWTNRGLTLEFHSHGSTTKTRRDAVAPGRAGGTDLTPR